MRRIEALVVVAGLLAASCGGLSAVDAVDAGRTHAYEPGVPNFDMESIVRMQDGAPLVEVFYGFPLASLVFVRSDDAFEAEYEFVVQLLTRDGRTVMREGSETKSIVVSEFDSTQSFRPRTQSFRLNALPGSYVVQASLTDRESGSTARRRQAVHIESIDDDGAFVSRVLVEGMREGGSFEPVVSLHMPSMMDSLRSSIQLYNLREEEDVEVTMRLLRFPSDTTVAAPPFWLIPSRGSLAYRGADFERADTLQVSRRSLRLAAEEAVVEFFLPRLSDGIYRIEIDGLDRAGTEMLTQRRYLSVKNSTFPEMIILEELVEALAYIAYEDEIAHILAGEAPMEVKRRFDAFWGSLVANRNVAANLIRLYYDRIEEANLLFTGYKQGWKTDRGMVYAIFGPPIWVSQRVDAEVWHYSYSDRDPVNTFVFERVRNYGDDPFENFVLQRRPFYQHEWSRAIERWRRGAVL